MGSHPSGNDIIMVRVHGAAPELRPEISLVVQDAMPWVDLGFQQRLSAPLQRMLASDAGGRLDPCLEAPTTDLSWFRWRLWDEKQSDERRRGEFTIGGNGTGISSVRVYVEPGRMFSPEEHQYMVEDIGRALQDATWETRKAVPGVRVQRSAGIESVARLVEDVSEEFRAAMSITRRPAVELAPTRPGERGLVASPRLHCTAELPENHIVGWWAAHRARALLSARREVQAQLERRREEQGRIDASIAGARSQDVANAIGDAERRLGVLDQLCRQLAPYVRAEPPNLRAIGPAVTRDPLRRRLLDALRNTMETSTIELNQKLSRFRERTFAALFEIWGAVAIAEMIVSLRWHVDGVPHVRWLDNWSPERIAWTFSRDGDRLELIYEPHARRRALMPQTRHGPYLHRLQRAACSADGVREAGLFAVGAAASPDYAIILHSRSGVAFTLGDALSSDFEYAKRQAKWTSVLEKLSKVARDYVHDIGWWSQEHLTTCSALSAFVLVPGDEDRWLAEEPVAKEVKLREVSLLCGRPRAQSQGGPIRREHVERILETLKAHAVDGSQRMPHMPGLLVESTPEQG